MLLNYILIVLQLAVVTEERNKLRNGAFKNVETLDASKNVNSVQVTVPFISLSFNLSCFLLIFFLVAWLMYTGI